MEYVICLSFVKESNIQSYITTNILFQHTYIKETTCKCIVQNLVMFWIVFNLRSYYRLYYTVAINCPPDRNFKRNLVALNFPSTIVNKYNQNIPGYESVNSSAVAVWRVSLSSWWQKHPDDQIILKRVQVLVSLLKQSWWLTPTTFKVASSIAPLVTMLPQGVALEMVFLALCFAIFWKKSSNHKQGAGGLLLLNRLLLPSEKHGGGYMCSLEPQKDSLCVCIYICRLWIFYLYPLEPENVNNKII